jgi:putative IMPACT (imprinted ancient) family translation regulator
LAGTLLGTSGLINAYRGAAADALEGAATIDKTIEAIYRLDFDYSIMSSVMNAVKGMELEMVRQEFAETAWLEVALRIGEKETLLHQLKAHIAGKRLTELDPEDKVEGLKVTYDRTRG